MTRRGFLGACMAAVGAMLLPAAKATGWSHQISADLAEVESKTVWFVVWGEFVIPVPSVENWPTSDLRISKRNHW